MAERGRNRRTTEAYNSYQSATPTLLSPPDSVACFLPSPVVLVHCNIFVSPKRTMDPTVPRGKRRGKEVRKKCGGACRAVSSRRRRTGVLSVSRSTQANTLLTRITPRYCRRYCITSVAPVLFLSFPIMITRKNGQMGGSSCGDRVLPFLFVLVILKEVLYENMNVDFKEAEPRRLYVAVFQCPLLVRYVSGVATRMTFSWILVLVISHVKRFE